jgi:hypothetical protein
MGSAPAPAIQTIAVPGGRRQYARSEYYGSAAQWVITETPQGDYPLRNVRECCVPMRPKSPVERCRSRGFLKQLFPCDSRDGSAPHSFKRRLKGRPVHNHFALLGPLVPGLGPKIKPSIQWVLGSSPTIFTHLTGDIPSKSRPRLCTK